MLNNKTFQFLGLDLKIECNNCFDCQHTHQIVIVYYIINNIRKTRNKFIYCLHTYELWLDDTSSISEYIDVNFSLVFPVVCNWKLTEAS